jgi:hypothetical protein
MIGGAGGQTHLMRSFVSRSTALAFLVLFWCLGIFDSTFYFDSFGNLSFCR